MQEIKENKARQSYGTYLKGNAQGNFDNVSQFTYRVNNWLCLKQNFQRALILNSYIIGTYEKIQNRYGPRNSVGKILKKNLKKQI